MGKMSIETLAQIEEAAEMLYLAVERFREGDDDGGHDALLEASGWMVESMMDLAKSHRS